MILSKKGKSDVLFITNYRIISVIPFIKLVCRFPRLLYLHFPLNVIGEVL